MKFIAFFLVGIASLFCFMGIAVSNAAAADYLGDFCWSAGPDGGILKVGVTSVGGGHHIVNGKILDPGGGRPDIVSGSAEIDGTNILVTLVDSGNDETAMWTNTISITIDLSTMNGKYEYIGHDRNYTDLSIDTDYDTGSLTFTQCP